MSARREHRARERAGTPASGLPGHAAPPVVQSTPSVAAPARRGITRWLRHAFVPDERLVRQGAWHVGVGVAVSVCAVVGMGLTAASVATDARLPTVLARWSGALVWQLLVSTGILASSRVGRLIAVASGAVALTGATLLAGLLFTSGPSVTVFRESLVAFTACLAVFAGSTALATLTPAARAWHDAREAMRAVGRKARSLAEWRRGRHDGGR
jgi:hypothetical protein